MNIKAAFQVQSVDGNMVTLAALKEGDHNEDWSSGGGTTSGSLVLSVDKSEAKEQFKVGQTVHVTLSSSAK